MTSINPNLKYAPSYWAIVNAEIENDNSRHENKGFLSFKRGFMPVSDPLLRLPEGFESWDNLALELPLHYKNQTLREAFRNLPVLDFGVDKLPDKYLSRASVLASMFAHAYVRCERVEDLDIPDTIQIPWKKISERLQRPVPFLSYIDLIVYNWKLKNVNKEFEVENLELLLPTVDNNEERVFYLTQTEILYKSGPIVTEVAEIQTAIINDNLSRVISGLQAIQKVIERLTEESFLKINPNPRSKTYVDPIVWAKTVAPFAVPLKEGVQGPSGTSSPIFHLIDTFIERSKYDSILGEEALFIRKWYPVHWREFLAAVEKVSLQDYIKNKNHEELNGAYYSLIESYAGKNGFLGVHKRKVYGYLQMAFKVGRSVTIGGFSGLFKERTWEEVDDELEKTRMERFFEKTLKCPFATIAERKTVSDAEIKNIKLDIRNKGVNYRPGDRIAISPVNDETIVTELITKLQVSGNEEVVLNPVWKEHVGKVHSNFKERLSLKEILQIGRLSKVSLDRLSQVPTQLQACLQGIIRSGLTLGFSDFVDVVLGHGLTAKVFIEDTFITDILDIEPERLYSVSSEGTGLSKESLELTVGKVKKGVASGFLHESYINTDNKIPFRVVRPLRFKLPEDGDRPIIMFAGGTGISPFKAFWEHLEAKGKLSKGWLFLSVRDLKSFPYKEELERLSLNGLNLEVTFSREDIKINKAESEKAQKLVFEQAKSSRLDKLLSQKEYQQKLYNYIKPERVGGKQAYIYVCGKAGFAKSVMDAIQNAIKIYAIKEDIDPQELFYELFSEDRYMQDIFTGGQQEQEAIRYYHISDIVKRNNEKYGYWILVNKKVYDLTEFKEIHPGGEKIVLDNAGRDGTREFQRAEHHLNPEIMSLLSMYYVGESIELVFDNEEIAYKYQTWLQSMHLTTEMQNTLFTDYTFTGKKTTRLDTTSRFTPFKAALILENHSRFNIEYIPLLIDNLLLQFEGEDAVNDVLQNLKSGALKDAASARRNFEADILHTDDELRELLVNIEEADKKLIADLRNVFWAGLKYYESYEEELKDIFRQNMYGILDVFITKLDIYSEVRSSFSEKISILKTEEISVKKDDLFLHK